MDTAPRDPWASIRVARLNASKPCKVLGVSVQRDGEEITPQAARAAFRKCAVRYHPDKLQQNNITGKEAEQAKEKFRECREAADLFADASRSRQFHYNYAVIGTRLPDNVSREVLDYDSDRDAHRIRDRASWLESSGCARPWGVRPPARRRGDGACQARNDGIVFVKRGHVPFVPPCPRARRRRWLAHIGRSAIAVLIKVIRNVVLTCGAPQQAPPNDAVRVRFGQQRVPGAHWQNGHKTLRRPAA